jgi:hypothetical protein
VHPVYLIDLETQQAFTFYKQDSQLFISVDTLDKHFEEVLYKPRNKRKDVSYRYVPGVPPQVIAGKTCYTAQRVYKEDTSYFRYTMEPIKLKSPLNVYVPDFPYPILSLDTKSIKPKTGAFEANVTFIIKELQEVNLPDDLFVIPQNAILKYNVPLADMVHGIDIYGREN